MYLTGGTLDSLAGTPGATILGPGDGNDVYVVKISPAQEVQYLIEIGGSSTGPGIGSSPVGMVVDSAGDVYIAGNTSSSDFPTTAGALETSSNGGGFLLKLDSSGHLIFSTYFDQTGTTVLGLAVDQNGNSYLVGNTTRQGFPTTKGAYLENSGISSTASFVQIGFISEVDSKSATLLSSTFLGPVDGLISDGVSAIALDGSGVVHVSGRRGAGDFPTTPGAPYTSTAGTDYDGFLVRLNPSLSTILYSTVLPVWGTCIEATPTGDSYLQGEGAITAIAANGTIEYNQTVPVSVDPISSILLDNGEVLVAGSTGQANFPTRNTLQPCEPNLTQDAPTPSTPPGTQRITVTIYDASGKMTFSTLLGGIGQYGFAAVGRDLSGNIYVSGWSFGSGEQFPGGPLLIGGRSNSFVFQLDLNEIPRGLPAPSCLANGATIGYSPAAPGLIATLYGSNLGPDTGVQFQLDSNGHVGIELGGTVVTVGGVPAPLLYVQDQQINFVIPFEVVGSDTSICVAREIERGRRPEGTQSCIFAFVAAVSPGVFGVYSASSNVAVMFGTGMGLFDRNLVDGTLNGPPLANLTNPVQATFSWNSCSEVIGFVCNPASSPGTVLFAGGAPGEVAGVEQINVEYPTTLINAISNCALTSLLCSVGGVQLSLIFGSGGTVAVPLQDSR